MDKWVKAKDCLPTKRGDYLCLLYDYVQDYETNDILEIKEMVVAYFNGRYFDLTGYEGYLTYWMELPSLPSI